MEYYEYKNDQSSEARPYDYAKPIEIKEKKKMPGWVKAIIIILCIALGLCIMMVGCGVLAEKTAISDISSIIGGSTQDNEVALNYKFDYIGTLYVNGEISESATGTYYHEYILNLIDAMENDDHNKGIILWVNTPGGTVFASDELYLKLMEYKKITGRPVYSSMQSQATSGGYYISAAADKIIANRNCWTGSIGVTMGTFINVSELLEKLGVQTVTVTAGDNKAMGGYFDEITDEQVAIFKSLVDDAYEQFTAIVAEGRNMDIKDVKKLADGRIYTARQALDLGLIDEIGTYEDTIREMRSAVGIKECAVIDFETYDNSFYLPIFGKAGDKDESALSEIEKLLEMNGTFEVSYMSQVTK